MLQVVIHAGYLRADEQEMFDQGSNNRSAVTREELTREVDLEFEMMDSGRSIHAG